MLAETLTYALLVVFILAAADYFRAYRDGRAAYERLLADERVDPDCAVREVLLSRDHTLTERRRDRPQEGCRDVFAHRARDEYLFLPTFARPDDGRTKEKAVRQPPPSWRRVSDCARAET